MAPTFGLGGAPNSKDRDRISNDTYQPTRSRDTDRSYSYTSGIDDRQDQERERYRRKYSITRKDSSPAPTTHTAIPPLPTVPALASTLTSISPAQSNRDREKDRHVRNADPDRGRDSRPARHGPPPLSLSQSFNLTRVRPSSQQSSQPHLLQSGGGGSGVPSHSHSQPSSFGQSTHQQNLSQFLMNHSSNHRYPPLSPSSEMSSTSVTSTSSTTPSPSPSSAEWPQQPQQGPSAGQRHNMDERLSVGNLRASYRTSVQNTGNTIHSAARASTFSNASTATSASSSSGQLQLGLQGVYDALPASIGRSKSPGRKGSSTSATTSNSGRPQLGLMDPASPGEERRLGMVFRDSFNASSDGTNATNPASIPIPPTPVTPTVPAALKGMTTTTCTADRPPPSIPTSRNTLGIRSRTFTMDSSVRQPFGLMSDSRNRVGSFSAASSLISRTDESRYTISAPIDGSLMGNFGTPSVSSGPPVSMVTRDKKGSGAKRLIKRNSSRPTSPVPLSPLPCVDSLLTPISTTCANRILLLMKTLCGRMRGNIDYQTEAGGSWHSGVCWIEEEAGCLMFDSGAVKDVVVTLCGDLWGSRVEAVEDPDSGRMCIDLITVFPVMDILIRPAREEEYDLWMAALLCWQLVKSPLQRYGSVGVGSVSPSTTRPELRRKGSSGFSNTGMATNKSPSIIKVARVSVWDKGQPTSPRGIYKSPSLLDPKATKDKDNKEKESSWTRLSCLLEDNGELKLLTENDSILIATIDLTQLSRSAIQPLDRTIFEDVEHCIAIFPIYAPGSTQLSVFRPIYITFESCLIADVWYVLLRSFARPHLLQCDTKGISPPTLVDDIDEDKPGLNVFRVERTLKIRITEAKLRACDQSDSNTKYSSDDSMTGNYFVEVMLDGEIRTRTAIKNNTKNPFWREECSFGDISPIDPLVSIVLKRLDIQEPEKKLHFGNKVGKTTEIFCGSVEIPMEQLDRILDQEQWLTILDPAHQGIGTMLVKVQHEEMAVLLAAEYEPLKDLLQRFPTGLTSQIAKLMPSNLRRLAEVLLNIFQASGLVNEWLMTLVEEEIDGITNQAPVKNYRFSSRLRSNESIDVGVDRFNLVRDMSKSLADEANLLFRGNSLLTQALECHMRRMGKQYLEEVLRDKIVEINNMMNPNCEIDPSKLEPGDDLNRHAILLTKLTTEVWECIANSVAQLPPDMRHILKYVKAVAEDRYGDFLRAVSYTSVTGFLFLRFICPAILSPKLFGMLRDLPTPKAQRTFTLIAKVLQAMANLSSFGQKEAWMEPMNRFLNSQRGALKAYVDEVCSIPGDQKRFVLNPAYSTPIAILSRVAPTAREGIPSLPYLVDSSRSLAMLVKLWTDNHGEDSSNLPGGDVLIFNQICHALQRRADLCIRSAELLRSPDSVTNQVVHETLLNPTSPTESGSLWASAVTSMSGTSLSSMSAWSARDTDRAPGSAGSDAIETSLSRRRTLTHDNSYATLPTPQRVSGTPTTTPSISASISTSTSTATSTTGQPLSQATSPGGLGRFDIQSLAQLQLQMGQVAGNPVSDGPISPVVTMKGQKGSRSTRNILSGFIKMGRGGDQGEGSDERGRGK